MHVDYPLRRRDVVAKLMAQNDHLVIAGLGSTAWDVTAAGDRALTFPLWGAMGGAVALGLGLALAQPKRRVMVITGDGELLMGLGSLATVAAQRPANLAIAVIDNERYGETGMQPTHTAFGADLAAIAAGCGIASALTVTDSDQLAAAATQLQSAPGPVFAAIKVRPESGLPLTLPPQDGGYLKDRFRLALLGAKAVSADGL